MKKKITIIVFIIAICILMYVLLVGIFMRPTRIEQGSFDVIESSQSEQ